MPFSVFFDTCSLYGEIYCDIFLTLAEERLYVPYWSQGVLDELRRVVKLNNPTADIDKRIEYMQNFFPDATITSYETLIDSMTCDEGDRHVLAAAHMSPAHTLVTSNVKDFPEVSLRNLPMSVKSPDDFLLDVLDINRAKVAQACFRRLKTYRNKPRTSEEYEQFWKFIPRILLMNYDLF